MSRKHVFGAPAAMLAAAGAGCIFAFLACSSDTPDPTYTVVYVPPGDDGAADGSGDDSGDDAGGGDDGGAVYGNCPDLCPTTGTNCCLYEVDSAAGVLGTCQTPSACATTNGSYIGCGNTPDTADCPDGSTACCLSFSDSGAPSSYCAPSCPGTYYACNGDQTTCPPDRTDWACVQIPGTTVPMAALGQCVLPDGAAGTGAPTDAGGQ
jgi:hypothetical protein